MKKRQNNQNLETRLIRANEGTIDKKIIHFERFVSRMNENKNIQ